MTLLQLLDGSVEAVGNESDFLDLIDRKLGMDARDWLELFLKNRDDESVENIKTGILDIKDELSDVMDSLEELT